MIIESWIAAILLACLGVMGLLALLSSMIESDKLEKSQEENARLREEINSRDIIIEKLNGKLLVKTATEFYNEGKKK